MAKFKVYELAKEVDRTSKEVLAFLQENGIEAKAAQSSVEEASTSLLCLSTSFASSYTLNLAILLNYLRYSFNNFVKDFANPGSVTAKDALISFPMECPNSSFVP